MSDDTRTTIFGVLVLVGKPVSARELIALCRPLGLSATNVKSHLTRLAAEGAVTRTGLRRSHRYAVSPGRQEVVRAIASRLGRENDDAWDGAWVMVALKRQARSKRQQLRGRLWFEGFRPCGTDTYLRPAWPRAWALSRARELAGAASACVMGPLVGTLDVGRVRKMYGLVSIDAKARQLARRIATADRIEEGEEAFRARLMIGGEVVTFISHVPSLPGEIWGDLRGLADLRAKYSRFDARVAPRAEVFVGSILSDKPRPESPALPSRRALVRRRSGVPEQQRRPRPPRG